MDRRVVLKDLFLVGMGAYMPKLAGAHTRIGARKPAAQTSTFHSFKLGALDLTVLTDGALHMTPVQPSFAAGAPAMTVDSLLKAKFRSTEEVALGVNILAIRTGKKNILIDTGCGAGFGTGTGWLPASLHAAGLSPASITDIVITHAHPDHIGGLLQPDGSLAFPQASIHLNNVEYKFWTQDAPDFSHSKLNNTTQLKQIIASTHAALLTLKPRLSFFDDGDERLDCLRLEKAPGHTPGHTIVHIRSEGEEMVHIADLLHSDALQFAHPEWPFYGDTDFTEAAATREKVLARLSAAGTKVFAYHLAWPGIGHARKKDNEYEWIAETYPTPG